MPRKAFIRLGQWFVIIGFALTVIVAPASAQGNSHIVQRGETLYRIALRYGVSVEALAQANGIVNPNQIYAGQVLVLPGENEQSAISAPGTSVAPAATAPVYHIVQPGETLGSIANRYGVSWQELAQANNIVNPNRILVGQQLTIMSTSAPGTPATVPAETPPTAPSPAAPAVEENSVITPAPETSQPRTHVVQRGETLSQIARRYGVSWTTIASANGIVDPNRIYAGQSLSVPGGDNSGFSQTYMEPTTGFPAAPTPTITNGRQIIVDLSQQRVYAYENGQLLRNVLVSTGLPGTPTVLGDYNIYWKLTSQTMSGPGYYLPGVPWVMYFYQGYSFHGTYWHNNFGQPMSHGCVNMPTPEAEWLFNWAEVGTAVRVIP